MMTGNIYIIISSAAVGCFSKTLRSSSRTMSISSRTFPTSGHYFDPCISSSIKFYIEERVNKGNSVTKTIATNTKNTKNT